MKDLATISKTYPGSTLTKFLDRSQVGEYSSISPLRPMKVTFFHHSFSSLPHVSTTPALPPHLVGPDGAPCCQSTQEKKSVQGRSKKG